MINFWIAFFTFVFSFQLFASESKIDTIRSDLKERRSIGNVLKDSVVQIKLDNHQMHRQFKPRDLERVFFVVYDNKVLVYGSVKNSQLKNDIESRIQERYPRITTYNHLDIRSHGSMRVIDDNEDRRISSELKHKLYVKDLIDNHIVVSVVYDKVVYLMGIVNIKEHNRILKASYDILGVKKVVDLLERIKG